MFEDMHSILEVYRATSRVDAFMRLGKIISTTDFGENLQITITNLIALDYDSTSRCEDLENEVCIMTQQLLTNMAITVTKDNIYAKPGNIADILEVILDELDDFEDYETPLKIIESEPSEAALACIVGFIKAKPEYNYIDIIDTVYQGTIDKLKTVLETREKHALANMEDVDRDPVLAMHCNFVLSYIDNFSNADLFADYGYVRSIDAIIGNSDISNIRSMKDKVELLAATLFTHYHSYEEAYEHIEIVTSYITDNDTVIHDLNMEVSNLIAVLYKEVTDEEA